MTRVTGPLAAVLLLSILVGEIGGAIWVPLRGGTVLAVVAATLLAAVHLRHVIIVGQVMAGLALVSMIAVLIWAPEARPQLWNAARQGTIFSAFLTSLGLLRGPVRQSRFIGLAAETLFSFPPRLRPATLTWGTQFLSVLFNLATISILSDIANAHGQRAAQAGRAGVAQWPVTMAAARGTTLSTMWNPVGVGFAIVTTSVAGLAAGPFLALACAAAMVLSLASLLLPGRGAPPRGPGDPLPQPIPPGGLQALGLTLLAVAVMIGLTLLIHSVLDVSFLVAAALIIPALALSWPLVEPGLKAAAQTGAIPAMADAARVMSNEATIFFAAALFSCGVSLVIGGLGLTAMIASGALPALVVILLALVAVPFGAAVLIPHSISMVLVAQILGQGPIGVAHPMALGLALCCSWCCAIFASPISAISIITARYLGVSLRELCFGINLPFTLVAVALSALMVSGVYMLD
ncbi:MAG TPA: hypothetical protein VGC40_05590 [Paenirhodobacter sp.]